jgi:hypothetical protein
MDREETLKYLIDRIRADNDGKHVDYAVPGFLSKKLKTYQSMREEILFCHTAANYLLTGHLDKPMTISFFHSMIILYGKCFTDAQSSKSAKLEIKDCFATSEAELLKTHEEIMHTRHNFVAHRGITNHEVSLPYLKLNVKDLSRQVKVKQIRRIAPTKENLIKYIQLFEHIIKVVEKNFEREGNKIWGFMLANFTNEQLSHFIIVSPKSET